MLDAECAWAEKMAALGWCRWLGWPAARRLSRLSPRFMRTVIASLAQRWQLSIGGWQCTVVYSRPAILPLAVYQWTAPEKLKPGSAATPSPLFPFHALDAPSTSTSALASSKPSLSEPAASSCVPLDIITSPTAPEDDRIAVVAQQPLFFWVFSEADRCQAKAECSMHSGQEPGPRQDGLAACG